ncbi:formylglycine-generating enzyme family protein [Spirosoma knui]
MKRRIRIGKMSGLGMLLLAGACQSKPDSYAFTDNVTVYAPTDQRPTVEKAADIAVRPPAGMVYVPGGLTQIGALDGMPHEKPVFWVSVKPFFMDEHPVTVAEFRRFVDATSYKTEAEKLGDAGVLDETTQEWTLVKGAAWQYPQGPDKPKAPDDHPVTQVSWNDARQYANWAGKRLPYEFEWEHAARNAINSRTLYPFGNDLQTASGKFRANTWNGTFPQQDDVLDGFHYTSPVGYYGKTPLGLTDMTGNVWEWCEDWRQTYADVLAKQKPQSPTEKVQRGGSFLCEPGWCHGYRVSGRSFTSPETSLMHVGFRCVRDIHAPVKGDLTRR